MEANPKDSFDHSALSLRFSETSLSNIVPVHELDCLRSRSCHFEHVHYVLDTLRHQLQLAEIDDPIIEAVVSDVAEDALLLQEMFELLKTQQFENTPYKERITKIFDIISCHRTLSSPRRKDPEKSYHNGSIAKLSYMPLARKQNSELIGISRSTPDLMLLQRKDTDKKEHKGIHKKLCVIM